MSKFEVGKIYCKEWCGKADEKHLIRIVKRGEKMVTFEHITVDGKVYDLGQTRAKIREYGDNESIYLPIGICGTSYWSKYEYNKEKGE